jgi:hypothetical protein
MPSEHTSSTVIWFEALRCSMKPEELVSQTGDLIGIYTTVTKANEAAQTKQHLLIRLTDKEYERFCKGELKSTKAYYIREMPVALVDESGLRGRTKDGRTVELTESLLMEGISFGDARTYE